MFSEVQLVLELHFFIVASPQHLTALGYRWCITWLDGWDHLLGIHIDWGEWTGKFLLDFDSRIVIIYHRDVLLICASFVQVLRDDFHALGSRSLLLIIRTATYVIVKVNLFLLILILIIELLFHDVTCIALNRGIDFRGLVWKLQTFELFLGDRLHIFADGYLFIYQMSQVQLLISLVLSLICCLTWYDDFPPIFNSTTRILFVVLRTFVFFLPIAASNIFCQFTGGWLGLRWAHKVAKLHIRVRIFTRQLLTLALISEISHGRSFFLLQIIIIIAILHNTIVITIGIFLPEYCVCFRKTAHRVMGIVLGIVISAL